MTIFIYIYIYIERERVAGEKEEKRDRRRENRRDMAHRRREIFYAFMMWRLIKRYEFFI